MERNYIKRCEEIDFINDFEQSDAKSGADYFDDLSNVIGTEVLVNDNYDEFSIIELIDNYIKQEEE